MRDEDSKAETENATNSNVEKDYRWKHFQSSPGHQKDNVLYGNTELTVWGS